MKIWKLKIIILNAPEAKNQKIKGTLFNNFKSLKKERAFQFLIFCLGTNIMVIVSFWWLLFSIRFLRDEKVATSSSLVQKTKNIRAFTFLSCGLWNPQNRNFKFSKYSLVLFWIFYVFWNSIWDTSARCKNLKILEMHFMTIVMKYFFDCWFWGLFLQIRKPEFENIIKLWSSPQKID